MAAVATTAATTSEGSDPSLIVDTQLEATSIPEPISMNVEERFKLKVHLADLKSQLKTLTDRCDQFNDVKQSIRSVNELIKEEV